jgi:hypothetical protein
LGVVSCAADQDVAAAPAVEPVAPRPADRDVVAGAAEQDVDCGAAGGVLVGGSGRKLYSRPPGLFISIFGVAIMDGLLLVSYFNSLRAQGLPLREAILQGAEKRVRPVMMTALTAIFGLLPAALSTKIGSQTQRPLAIVVVGGMITTLFLTRYLMPVLYSFYVFHLEDARRRLGEEQVARRRAADEERAADRLDRQGRAEAVLQGFDAQPRTTNDLHVPASRCKTTGEKKLTVPDRRLPAGVGAGEPLHPPRSLTGNRPDNCPPRTPHQTRDSISGPDGVVQKSPVNATVFGTSPAVTNRATVTSAPT